jgi:hypothetical protein
MTRSELFNPKIAKDAKNVNGSGLAIFAAFV